MIFNGGKHWGGTMTVYPVRSTTGRLLIGVTNDAGRKYFITVSRWINERRAGTIKEVK